MPRPESVVVRLGEPSVSAWNAKFPVILGDGAEVEAVLYRGDTLCVSSQVGCGVRCPFCASGANGLGRSLTLDELRGQLEAVEARGQDVRRVTVSGVGEPLHNVDAVLAFVETCRARGTPASVTTSGGSPDRLARLLQSPHNGVTISVHAGTEAIRRALVPGGPSLSVLGDALGTVLPSLSRSVRKKVALAYLLVGGRNDDDDEIDAFARFAAPFGVTVHLYSLNVVPGTDAAPVDRTRYQAAYDRLVSAGLRVRMSSQARIDANGGCGTLVAARALRRATPLVTFVTLLSLVTSGVASLGCAGGAPASAPPAASAAPRAETASNPPTRSEVPGARAAEVAAPVAPLRYVERCVAASCDERLPMVVVMHGLGDTPAAFVRVYDVLPVPARVIALEAPLPWGEGFAWVPYRARDSDPVQLAAAYRALVPRVVSTVRAALAARPSDGRVVLSGFSQGAMMAYSVAALDPTLARVTVPIGGFLPPGITPLGGGAGIVAYHGIVDPVVPIAPDRTSIAAFAAVGRRAELVELPGVQHAIPPEVRARVAETLGVALLAE